MQFYMIYVILMIERKKCIKIVKKSIYNIKKYKVKYNKYK